MQGKCLWPWACDLHAAIAHASIIDRFYNCEDYGMPIVRKHDTIHRIKHWLGKVLTIAYSSSKRTVANKGPSETVPILEVGERTWHSGNNSHRLVVAWSESWLACTCFLERSTHCTSEIMDTPCRGDYNMSVVEERGRCKTKGLRRVLKWFPCLVWSQRGHSGGGTKVLDWSLGAFFERERAGTCSGIQIRLKMRHRAR
jgi:hypothetical protein